MGIRPENNLAKDFYHSSSSSSSSIKERSDLAVDSTGRGFDCVEGPPSSSTPSLGVDWAGRTRAFRGCDCTEGLPCSPIPCTNIEVTRLSQSTASRFLAAILLCSSRKSDGTESVLG